MKRIEGEVKVIMRTPGLVMRWYKEMGKVIQGEIYIKDSLLARMGDI